MPGPHHAVKRPLWNAARAAVRPMERLAERPRTPLRFRPIATWFGRCPAFRPSHPEDEPRGRMAHAED
jgi:hypothetical protein